VADDTFKLPGSSYSELVKIIRAYGHAPDDAVPKDVGDRAGMDPTIVSRNNAFLVSVGILTAGKKKSLTSPGRALAQALDFEMPDSIATAWRSIAAENDFLRKIISAVSIRGGMEGSSLRSHVAYTAGAPNKPAALTGAGSVIDVLKAAGMLVENESGKIFAKAGEQVTAPTAPTASTVPQFISTAFQAVGSGSQTDAIPPATPAAQTNHPEQRAGLPVSVQIQVRIECTPADIPSLGSQLRELLSTLRQSNSDTDSNDE
jgi:hypothetical protein